MNDFGEPGLGGWWAGLIIGFVVVVVVVVIVGTLLMLARRIGERANAAVGLLEQTREATRDIGGLAQTDKTLQSIARGAVAARQALGG